MNETPTLSNFLVNQNVEVDLPTFAINLILTAILSLILGAVYSKFGLSLSNRRLFARNFLLISTTTMLIITVVKSSLALSLGLVGALSIVRFRSAIKEPEELSFLFMVIAIGLGMGANQRLLTLVGFTLVVGMVMIMSRLYKREAHENMVLSITSPTHGEIKLNSLVDVLQENCSEVKLKRFDESGERLESTFLVQFTDFQQLEASRAKIKEMNEGATVTFIDNKVIG